MAENSTQAVKRGRGRPPLEEGKSQVQVAMIIRARREWIEWMDRFCERIKDRTGLALHIDRSDVVDASLAIAAKQLELPPPPPRY